MLLLMNGHACEIPLALALAWAPLVSAPTTLVRPERPRSSHPCK